MLWRWRALIGYRVARALLAWRWAVSQPRLWNWMQGQYSRKAALGDRDAQSFYGHLLLFRGQGLGARQEGLRLLRLAAAAGEPKSAYQLGMIALKGDAQQMPDAPAAVRYWSQAAEAGHPLAALRLAELLEKGGEEIEADPQRAAYYRELAEQR